MWHGFTIDWYPKLFANDDLLDALSDHAPGRVRRGDRVDVLGSLLGLGLARLRFRGRGATETLLLLPMVTPEIVMGISLLIFFVQLFGQQRVVRPDLDRPHHVLHLVRGGRRPGAGGRAWIRTWRRPPATSGASACGRLPARHPAAHRAGRRCRGDARFALSFDDLVVTSFNAGVGSTTLPIYIYSSIKFGVTPADQRDLDDHRGGRRDRPVHRLAARHVPRRRPPARRQRG